MDHNYWTRFLSLSLGSESMLFLIVFMLLAIAALVAVGAINRAAEKERVRRMTQRKLKIHADALTEVVNCLEQITPSKIIAKLVNDEVIQLLTSISKLEATPPRHVLNSIERAQLRSEELLTSKKKASYQQESDTQIKYAQFQVMEAIKVMRHLFTQNIIKDTELKAYEAELNWTHLMVAVTSSIAQGQEFLVLDDFYTAQNYFRQAQQLLRTSKLNDERREAMMLELDEMIDGSRHVLSKGLMSDGNTNQ